MTLNIEQIAEILAGVVRSQQAIIDAIESENGGWRNTHLLPKLNTASNMRLATPRLLDIPARILLRSQGRVPMDVETITRVLREALTTTATAPVGPVSTAPPIAASATVAAVTAAASIPSSPENNDLGNFFDK